MTERQYKTIDWVYTLAAWGMFLVVVGHTFGSRWFIHSSGSFSQIALVTRRSIYLFHMPLLFFVFGFLFAHTQSAKPKPFSLFLKEKVLQLLLPYFVWGNLALLMKVAIPKYTLAPVKLSLTVFMKNWAFGFPDSVNFFWFIITLFGVFVVAYPADRLVKKLRTPLSAWAVLFASLVIKHLLSGVLPGYFRIDRVVSMFPYFWTGYIFHAYYKPAVKLIQDELGYLTVGFGLLYVVMVYFFNPDEGDYYVAAMTGILFSLCLAIWLGRVRFNPLQVLKQKHYTIYLTHWFFIVAVRVVACKILHLPYFSSSLFMLASGLFFPVVLYRVMDRFDSLPVRSLFGLLPRR